ncbi:MAG: hypothetical protein SWK76_03730 [Actinomycetota bacterium]|nr:hypothetical protein [Actinomycetota bacterium]
MTAHDIAEKVVRAVEKNRLYVFLQLSAKILWMNKRLLPKIYFSLLSFLYRHEIAEPVFMLLARNGLIWRPYERGAGAELNPVRVAFLQGGTLPDKNQSF